MTKYTKAPWEFGNTSDDKRLILGGEGRRYVCSVQIWQNPRRLGLIDEPEREANAQLIASAPELLEALKRFVENSPCTNGCDKNDMTCDTQFAKKAIAKAEGK